MIRSRCRSGFGAVGGAGVKFVLVGYRMGGDAARGDSLATAADGGRSALPTLRIGMASGGGVPDICRAVSEGRRTTAFSVVVVVGGAGAGGAGGSGSSCRVGRLVSVGVADPERDSSWEDDADGC